MVTVRDLGTSTERWSEGVNNGQQRYQEGVENPQRDWADETRSATDRWAQGVQDAATDGRFDSAVQSTETSDWQQFATALGPARFREAADSYDQKYRTNFEPFRQTIEQTSLPSRGPAGDPANYDRVREIGQALHDEKVNR